MNAAKRARKIDRGDFQTPTALAEQVLALVSRRLAHVTSVVEPTCGEGSLLVAAARAFPAAANVRGLEIDAGYADAAAAALAAVRQRGASVRRADFFDVDWRAELGAMPDPMLVLGNPPWVTSAGVTRAGGRNVPRERTTAGLRGLEAVTGKSNFDISEWMIWRLVEALEGRDAAVAMLCKTAVARKVLARVWAGEREVVAADLYRVDAKQWFGAAVDAGLLVLRMGTGPHASSCAIWPALDAGAPTSHLGWRAGMLVADVDSYERTKHLGGGGRRTWRSGIKHDCARVMELRERDGGMENGLGERVDVEDELRLPMRKGSEIAADITPPLTRYMIVPQRRVGEDTAPLERAAPKAWSYLGRHGHKLDARASSIYRGRPRFSVFGVGDYTFAPWKVAIAGLYKSLAFRVVGPHQGRPVVLDDTCYFLPCDTEGEAHALARVLRSDEARAFYGAIAFWDAKRPVTSAMLSRLDIDALASQLGVMIPG